MSRRTPALAVSSFSVPAASQASELLAREARVPLIIAQLLCSRGIETAADAERFFSPALAHLHDPYAMRGMRDAVDRIHSAVNRQEPVLIYGDYDVDGTVATVLLKTAIERRGGRVRYHVPHRIRDGYGMQAETLKQSAGDGVRLVISVDKGIRA